MRRLHWFSFRDHRRHKWNLYFSSHHWCPDLVDGADRLDGVTIYKPRIIYVEVALPVREHGEVVNHEWEHVHLGETPALSKLEESIIQRLSPNIFPTYVRFGLRLPSRPAGYHAMARAARKLDRALSPLEDDEEEAA